MPRRMNPVIHVAGDTNKVPKTVRIERAAKEWRRQQTQGNGNSIGFSIRTIAKKHGIPWTTLRD